MKYHILNDQTPVDIDLKVKVSSTHALCTISPTQNEDIEVIRHDAISTPPTTLSLGVSGDSPNSPVVPMIPLGTVRGILTHTTMTLYYNPLNNLIYLVPDIRRVCGNLDLLPPIVSLEIIRVGGNTKIILPLIHTLGDVVGIPGITGNPPSQLPAGATVTKPYTAGLDIHNEGYSHSIQSISVPGNAPGKSIRTNRSLVTMVSLGNVLSLGASGANLPTSVVTQNSITSYSVQNVGHKIIPDDYELVFFLNMF